MVNKTSIVLARNQRPLRFLLHERRHLWHDRFESSQNSNRYKQNWSELGLPFATARYEKGLLVVGADKFMVYEMMFNDLPAIRAEVGRRLSLLESGAPPSELPACPAWMAKTCPYRDRCGCGDAA